MKRTFGAALLATTTLLMTPATAAGPLLVNGDFTSPPVSAGQYQRLTTDSDLPGWTVASGDVDLYSADLARLDGAQSLNLTGSHNGAISQSLSLLAGRSYELTWHDAPDTWPGSPQDPGASDPEKESCLTKPNDDQAYNVAVPGRRPVTFTPAGSGGQSPDWQPKSLRFTAGEDDSVIRFVSQAATQSLSHCGPQITRVNVRPAPGPTA
ncbi:DUF642 domain-containing protein [Streptomyces silvensis]|uniref:DUF642 domain-containing protein n=1 Tax=Streptomyces silvensis TaxID=1765722 RepID=A0A0W7X8Y6_9ACTN|nr:DUF642 domain-containing protein [Streptomyces silvensis]KUF19204.1 hypothetical protein AT728_21880 [Streptomyces silvensis]